MITEPIKGQFSVTNPNFQNSDKTVFAKIQAQENDQLKDFGYKTNKTGFEVGTSFEYLDDLNLGLSTRNFLKELKPQAHLQNKKNKKVIIGILLLMPNLTMTKETKDIEQQMDLDPFIH